MDTTNLVQKLQADDELAPYAEALAALARPAIDITIEDASDTLPTGASKFGGLPDVPAGFVWPEKEGTALNFLAQIRLADVVPYDMTYPLPPEGQLAFSDDTDAQKWETKAVEHLLPADGLLAFFYDAHAQPWGAKEQEGGWRILYFTERTPLTAAIAPDNLISLRRSDTGVMEQRAISFLPGVTWPSWDDPMYQNLNLSEEAEEAFDEFDRITSHLLGLATPVQGDVRSECQQWANSLTYWEAKEQGLLDRLDEWQLLLQLDSEASMNWMWCDAGSIYFMIRREDLQAKCFENVWLIMQCH